MPTYILMLRFTQQGMEKIRDGPTRLDAARQTFRAMGVDLKAFYLVTGRYDAIVVCEAPEDESVAKVALTIGSRGNVRTETLRAFTEAEYRRLVGALP